MKEIEKNPIVETAEQAIKSCEQALRNSLRTQEEATQRLTAMCNQAAQESRKRFPSLANLVDEMMPSTQKRMEEMMELMEKNTETSAELMKKALEAAQTQALGDCQSRWIEFWKASLHGARSNADAMTHINTRAMDAWMEFVQKNIPTTLGRMDSMTSSRG